MMVPVWIMPENAPYKKRAKAWLDFQNDVKVTDVELAAREGFESVEHAKRYTTLGMATDQGKLSNINGLAVLSHALGIPIPSVGTTTFRPPWTPISMGAIAGEARGELFQPIRKTPMHDWHEKNGAHWEPVGHWRRPYAYPARRRDHPRRGVTRSDGGAAIGGASRRLDARQDPGQGAGRGPLPRHALHQHDVDAGAGEMPLWPHVQRERLPDRRWRGGAARCRHLALPYDNGRRGSHPRPHGGMASDRVVGLEGLGRERDRAIRPDRGRRSPRAGRAGGGRRGHGSLEGVAALHAVEGRDAGRYSGQGVPHQLFGRVVLRGRKSRPDRRGRSGTGCWRRATPSASHPMGPRRCTSCAPRRASS